MKKVTSLVSWFPAHMVVFATRDTVAVISSQNRALTTQIGRPEMVVEVFLMCLVPETEPIVLAKLTGC